MAKKVIKFESTDGSVHDTEELADAQDHRLDTLEYFSTHHIYGNREGCQIDEFEIVDFLEEHAEVIKGYLESRHVKR